MNRIAAVAVIVLIPVVAVGADVTPPPWAYPVTDADFIAPKDDGTVRYVPNSARGFTMAEIDNAFAPPDWYPDEHPPMPAIVAHGRMPDVRACGLCHLPTGMGHPESSSLAGQPAAYIIQQMAAFKDGSRKSMIPARSASMAGIASAATDAEVKAAADYFSNVDQRPWIKVKEVALVPKTFVGAGNMRQVKLGAGSEPIGQRIIEVPDDSARANLRDSHSPFIAYVPVGSIERGKALVTTAGGSITVRCTFCHGADLRGLGNVPGIAARSPIYIVRQLFDMEYGSRTGASSDGMKRVVDTLSVKDMVDIAAYTASRAP